MTVASRFSHLQPGHLSRAEKHPQKKPEQALGWLLVEVAGVEPASEGV